MVEQARLAAASVRDALDQAEPVLDRLEDLCAQHGPSQPFAAVAHAMLDLIKGRPGVTYVSVSFPDGTFQGAYLDTDGVIRFQDSRVFPDGTHVDRFNYAPARRALAAAPRSQRVRPAGARLLPARDQRAEARLDRALPVLRQPHGGHHARGAHLREPTDGDARAARGGDHRLRRQCAVVVPEQPSAQRHARSAVLQGGHHPGLRLGARGRAAAVCDRRASAALSGSRETPCCRRSIGPCSATTGGAGSAVRAGRRRVLPERDRARHARTPRCPGRSPTWCPSTSSCASCTTTKTAACSSAGVAVAAGHGAGGLVCAAHHARARGGRRGQGRGTRGAQARARSARRGARARQLSSGRLPRPRRHGRGVACAAPSARARGRHQADQDRRAGRGAPRACASAFGARPRRWLACARATPSSCSTTASPTTARSSWSWSCSTASTSTRWSSSTACSRRRAWCTC